MSAQTELIKDCLASHGRACERLWLLYRSPYRFCDWLSQSRGLGTLVILSVLIFHAFPHVLCVQMGLLTMSGSYAPSLRESSLFAFLQLGLSESLKRMLAGLVHSGLVSFLTLISVWLPVAKSIKKPDPSFNLLSVVLGTTLTGILLGGVLFESVQLSSIIADSLRGRLILEQPIRFGIFYGLVSIIPINVYGFRKSLFSAANDVLRQRIGIAASILIVIGTMPLLVLNTLLDRHKPFTIWFNAYLVYVVVFWVVVLRIYYLPFHLLFIWPTLKGKWYRRHPMWWDDAFVIDVPWLTELLADYAKHDLDRAVVETQRLVSGLFQYRHAFNATQLMALRQLAVQQSLSHFPNHTFANFEWLRFMFRREAIKYGHGLEAIAQQQRAVSNLERVPPIQLQAARGLAHEIDNLQQRCWGYPEPLRSELRRACIVWMTQAETQISEIESRCKHEKFKAVFRAGGAVDIENEAFVPRLPVITEVASMVFSHYGCAGILLYARRRMGKSSCLKTLSSFLPSNVHVVYLNLQDPKITCSEGSFCMELGKKIAECLPAEVETCSDITSLARILEQVNTFFSRAQRRLLIGLDEYEYLDVMLQETRLPIGLPALFRTSIEEHRNVIWLFAGSRRIQELSYRQWASALISLRTIEISCFTATETQKLLTDPLEHSKLWKYRTAERPQFKDDFWGIDGIGRIQKWAGGWPQLVTLVAQICIEKVNQRNAERVTDELFDDVINYAVVCAENLMIELLESESHLAGEWQYLLGFKTSKRQPLPTNMRILSSLQRRCLVDVYGGEVWLRVPLMQKWIEERS
jgi:hypothetical protein